MTMFEYRGGVLEPTWRNLFLNLLASYPKRKASDFDIVQIEKAELEIDLDELMVRQLLALMDVERAQLRLRRHSLRDDK